MPPGTFGTTVLFALACAAAVAIVFHFVGVASGAVPYLLVLFFLLLSLGGAWLTRSKDPKQAVRNSMATMALKMFASLIVVVLVIFLSPREQVLPWALTFAGLYLAFLVFDTVHQFKGLRTPRP